MTTGNKHLDAMAFNLVVMGVESDELASIYNLSDGVDRAVNKPPTKGHQNPSKFSWGQGITTSYGVVHSLLEYIPLLGGIFAPHDRHVIVGPQHDQDLSWNRLPLDDFDRLCRCMDDIQDTLVVKRNRFVQHYERLLTEAQQQAGAGRMDFDPGQYPTPSHVRDMIGMKYQFAPIAGEVPIGA